MIEPNLIQKRHRQRKEGIWFSYHEIGICSICFIEEVLGIYVVTICALMQWYSKPCCII